MNRVAILGLGLMGGSIGLALRRRSFSGVVSGYARREEIRALALDNGMVDEAHADPAAAVRGADLVVLCLPILANEDVLRSCADELSPGAVVTDVGSTKAELRQALETVLETHDAEYVGSHPIAGSEQQGAEAAIAELYEGALVVVTPPSKERPAAVDRILAFWQSMGARTLVLDAEEHDRVLSRTSHLPHMAATAVALAVARGDAGDETGRFCGTGFLDTTRVAEGSPAVWLDIIRTNRQNVANELAALGTILEQLRDAIASGNDEEVLAILEKGKSARRRLLNTQDGGR